jgi:hypothetical protein
MNPAAITPPGSLKNKNMARERTTELNKRYGAKKGRPAGTTGIKKTVLKENKKEKRNFTISGEAAEYVVKKAAADGVSKSALVDQAILHYANVNPIEV